MSPALLPPLAIAVSPQVLVVGDSLPWHWGMQQCRRGQGQRMSLGKEMNQRSMTHFKKNK